MNRILLIEDNPELAALIASALAASGVAVDVFDRMDAARAAMRHVAYGALVLDRGLPDGDGLALLRSLRTAGEQLPCLVLTARDALHDRVDGLETGADDYLAKPFAMSELVARIRALLRRPADNWRSMEPVHGDLKVRTQACQMVCKDQQIVLAAAELQIMVQLVQAAGETVRRTRLEAGAWGLSEAVTLNALDVALHRLRRKLNVIGSVMEIVNVRGQGYALRQTELDR
jgi:DNA-binding response OmpR family regulator